MRTLSRNMAGALLALATACASAGTTGRPLSSSSLITREEIERVDTQSARQVIERLHPNWLRARGTTSNTGGDRVVVYMDINRLGYVDVLDQVRASDVEEMQFLSPAEATNRFGIGHPAGAIVLKVRRGG